MRTLFLLCCVVIVIAAIAIVLSQEPLGQREGPQYYSFTRIEAKPGDRALLLPLAILAILVILGTLWKLPK